MMRHFYTNERSVSIQMKVLRHTHLLLPKIYLFLEKMIMEHMVYRRFLKQKIDNFVMLCGHQHTEAVVRQDKNGIKDILAEIKRNIIRNEEYVLEKMEIAIEKDTNYLIRVGLGGPQGSHTHKDDSPHFAV